MGRLRGGELAVAADGTVTVTSRGGGAGVPEALDEREPAWETVGLTDLDDQVLPLTIGTGGESVLTSLTYDAGAGEFTAQFRGDGSVLSRSTRQVEQTFFDLPDAFVNDGEWGVLFRVTIVSGPTTGSECSVGVGIRDSAAVGSNNGLMGFVSDVSGTQTRVSTAGSLVAGSAVDYTGVPTSFTMAWIPSGIPGTDGGQLGVVMVTGYDNGAGSPNIAELEIRDTVAAGSLTTPIRPFLGFGFFQAASAAGTWVFKVQRRAFRWRLGFPEN